MLLLVLLNLLLLLASTCCAQTLPTTQQALRDYYAEPTTVVHFVPLMTDTPMFNSGLGFANRHGTLIKASFTVGQGTSLVGAFSMQTATSGDYSYELTMYPSPYMGLTSMSCSGDAAGSLRTCIWTIQSATGDDLTTSVGLRTYTYPDSSVWIYNYTQVTNPVSTLEPTISSSVFHISDHLHTFTMDMLMQPTASASPSKTLDSLSPRTSS